MKADAANREKWSLTKGFSHLPNAGSGSLERTVRRLDELEERVKFLEGYEKYMKAIAEKRRRNRCRLVTDGGVRFFLPMCMGGAVCGKDGCTCP